MGKKVIGDRGIAFVSIHNQFATVGLVFPTSVQCRRVEMEVTWLKCDPVHAN